MIRIAVLGGIGSGKTYIAKLFNFPVFNADLEVAKIYKNNKQCFKKLKKRPNYNKKLLSKFCKELNIRFTKKMLSWPKGKRKSDGIWSKIWYKNVELSNKFTSFKEEKINVPNKYLGIYKEALKYYDKMNKYSI